MSTLATVTASLPAWLLPLGWIALLLGWLLGRPAFQRFVNKVTVIGIANNTINSVRVTEHSNPAQGDSALSKVGNWATIGGLVLTLLPMLKEWLK